MRSASEPDPSSMMARPHVACGTKTFSTPSPSPATKRSHSAVRSNSPGRRPVVIESSAAFIATESGGLAVHSDPWHRDHDGPLTLELETARPQTRWRECQVIAVEREVEHDVRPVGCTDGERVGVDESIRSVVHLLAILVVREEL